MLEKIISTSGRETSKERYKCLLKALELNRTVYYAPIPNHASKVSPEEFADTLKSETEHCRGGAISKDIKASIIPFLDEIDASAASIQSVNTVIVLPSPSSPETQGKQQEEKQEEGEKIVKRKLKGYNTDVYGFHQAISIAMHHYNRTIDSVCIYGYGGVTLCCVYVLHELLGVNKNKIFITGRNMAKAYERAEQLGVQAWSASADSPASDYDLFINASPVTDQPLEQAHGFLQALHHCTSLVFDHEMPGQYLRDYVVDIHKNAMQQTTEDDIHQELVYISGYDMYYPQMKRQWHLFLNAYHISPERIDQELDALTIHYDSHKEVSRYVLGGVLYCSCFDTLPDPDVAQ